MIPDPGEQNVKFPVLVRNGRLEFFGGALPVLVEGTYAEIVVPAVFVEDQQLVELLTSQHEALMLPAGTELRLVIYHPRRGQLPDWLVREHSTSEMEIEPKISGVYVSMFLEDNLYIKLRGPKLGQLTPCPVRISDLDKTVQSLNQAYIEVSKAFEPQRATLGGNVFNRFYYLETKNKKAIWRPLSFRRDEMSGDDLAILKHSLFPWYYRQYASHQVEWVYPAVNAKGATTLLLIDDESTVWAEHYFRDQKDAGLWLRGNGYRRYHVQMASDSAGQQDFLEDYPEVDEQRPSAPPEPPYTKPNGEEVAINYSHFFEST